MTRTAAASVPAMARKTSLGFAVSSLAFGFEHADGETAKPSDVIRTGYGPENITRLRRFAIGVLKSKGQGGVAQKMRQLTRNVRLVFDYLRMSENSCACHLK